jgi:hypothetical protein
MEPVSLNVSPEIIKKIVEERIHAEIVKVLDGQTGLVDAMVKKVLELRVDKYGKESNYSSDNKYSWLEAMMGNVVREAAQQAMQGWAVQNKANIEKAMIRELNKSTSLFVKTFTESVVKVAGDQYAFQININPKEK